MIDTEVNKMARNKVMHEVHEHAGGDDRIVIRVDRGRVRREFAPPSRFHDTSTKTYRRRGKHKQSQE